MPSVMLLLEACECPADHGKSRLKHTISKQERTTDGVVRVTVVSEAKLEVEPMPSRSMHLYFAKLQVPLQWVA